MAFIDNFNRAGPGPGANWATALGTAWAIESSTVLKPQGSYEYTGIREVGTFPNDQYAEVKVEVPSAVGDISVGGPAVRMNGAGNCYRLVLNVDGLTLRKYVGGVSTYLTDAAGTYVVGTLYTVKLVVTGTTLEGFVGGVSQFTFTDSELTAGNPGCFALTGQTPHPRFDDFVSTDSSSTNVGAAAGAGTATAVGKSNAAAVGSASASGTAAASSTSALVLIGTTPYATIQAALDAAVAGDVIKCRPNYLFIENLSWTKNPASDVIVTTQSSLSLLPTAGVRTSPAYAAFMPRIQSVGGGATTVQIGVGASHLKFQHVEFPEVPGGYNAIICVGYGDATQAFASQEPHHITVDQCYIHGGNLCGQKRGIEPHGKTVTVTNNYFDDIFSVGQDSQCVGGYNGHGPLVVTNNRMCGGTEPFMLGGGDPSIRTLMVITSGASATGANVSCTEASHTLSELTVGQELAVKVAGTWRFTTVATITGAGATGSLTWASVGGVPDLPGDVRAGVILSGLTFERNLIEHKAHWATGILSTPTGVTATASTSSGTLPAGTYYYTRQAISTGGYQGTVLSSQQSGQVSATLGSAGRITITGAAVAGATSERVWRGTVSGVMTHYVLASSVGASVVDNGSLTWIAAVPDAATVASIKNLFELKAVQNASIKGNIFRWNLHTVDVGFAAWVKTANQDGTAPYLQSKNITMELNIFQHVDGFLEVSGREVGDSDPTKMPGPLTNFIVRNNLVIHSGYRGNGFAMIVANGAVGVNIDHNTILHKDTGTSGGLLTMDSDGEHLVGFSLTNNMVRKGTYGIHDPWGEGVVALNLAAPGNVFTKNAIADGTVGVYGAANFFETNTAWEAEFVNYVEDGTGADFRLKVTSPYHLAGTDGKDLGADVVAVLAETSGVDTGGASSIYSGAATATSTALGVGKSLAKSVGVATATGFAAAASGVSVVGAVGVATGRSSAFAESVVAGYAGDEGSLLINAVRKVYVDNIEREPRHWTLNIAQTVNGKDRFSAVFDSIDGLYRPALDSVVVVEEGLERIFAGDIGDPSERAIGDSIISLETTISALDFTARCSEVYVFENFAAGQTLKAIATRLAMWARLVLDPTQVEGPVINVELIFLDTKVEDAANQVTTLTGWIWDVDYYGMFSFKQPGVDHALFDIVYGDGNTIGDLTVNPSRQDYANRIIVRLGGAPYIAEDLVEGALHRVVEQVYAAPEGMTGPGAQSAANQILAASLPIRKIAHYTTYRPGLRVGQVQGITWPKRNVASTFLITDIVITDETPTRNRHEVSATEGVVYRPGWRETYKRWVGSSGTVLPAGIGGGGGGAVPMRPVYPLGGSRLEPVRGTGTSWEFVGTKVIIDTVPRLSTAAVVSLEMFARTDLVGVKARLYDISASAPCPGESVLIVATSPQFTNFPVTLTPGSHIYQLQVQPNVPDEDVVAMGISLV